MTPAEFLRRAHALGLPDPQVPDHPHEFVPVLMTDVTAIEACVHCPAVRELSR